MVGSLLDALPGELKLQIMIALDSKSLLRCASVSRSLYHTFRSSSLLLYTTQLELYHMEGTCSNIPFRARLFLLRDRQHAWERLWWKRTTTVEVAQYCQAYELVAGVFASSDGQNLKIIGLPSYMSDGYTLTRTSNVPIRDFAIDPTEDVVGFLEETIHMQKHIHIRKISTNTPLAVLTFTVPPDDPFLTPVLQFGYDLLGLQYASRILIWNWKHESLIFDSSCETLPHDIGDFVFLSRGTFLVTSTSLHIYTLNPPSSVTLVATLHLPPITQAYRHQTEIRIHSGPLHCRPPSGVSFTPSLSERIQVLSVRYGMSLKYTMFVHTSTLLQYVERHVNGDALPGLVIDWDMWGQDSTRFTKSEVPSSKNPRGAKIQPPITATFPAISE